MSTSNPLFVAYLLWAQHESIGWRETNVSLLSSGGEQKLCDGRDNVSFLNVIPTPRGHWESTRLFPMKMSAFAHLIKLSALRQNMRRMSLNDAEQPYELNLFKNTKVTGIPLCHWSSLCTVFCINKATALQHHGQTPERHVLPVSVLAKVVEPHAQHPNNSVETPANPYFPITCMLEKYRRYSPQIQLAILTCCYLCEEWRQITSLPWTTVTIMWRLWSLKQMTEN